MGKGSFVVPVPGVWRFTFQAGLVYIPFDWWQAFFFLWVDDIMAVALSNVSPIGGGDYTMTFDTIVPIKAGQRISLFWMNDQGCEIVGDSEQIFTHFTGEYLGSAGAPQ